jgi:hypothetical protein
MYGNKNIPCVRVQYLETRRCLIYCQYKFIGQYRLISARASRQVELSDEEINEIITILRFSKGACPIEYPPVSLDDDEVERLATKFEKILA